MLPEELLDGVFVELEKLPDLAPLLGCVVLLLELEKLPDLAPLLGVALEVVVPFDLLPLPLAKAVLSKVVKVKAIIIKNASIIDGSLLNLFFNSLSPFNFNIDLTSYFLYFANSASKSGSPNFSNSLSKVSISAISLRPSDKFSFLAIFLSILSILIEFDFVVA